MSIFLSKSQTSAHIPPRDVMLHARTVLHASSMYFRLDRNCARFDTSGLRQTMAYSDKRAPPTRIRVSPLSVFLSIDLTVAFSCSHPTEPQCSYDPVEGLPLAADADPIEKIRELEEQVGEFLYCCPCSAVLTLVCSRTHEKTEVSGGKRTSLSFSISQSSSSSF